MLKESRKTLCCRPIQSPTSMPMQGRKENKNFRTPHQYRMTPWPPLADLNIFICSRTEATWGSQRQLWDMFVNQPV